MKTDEEMINKVTVAVSAVLKENDDKCKNRLEGFAIVPLWAADVSIDKLPAGSMALTEDGQPKAASDSVGQVLRTQQALYNMMYKYQEKSMIDLYNSYAKISEQVNKLMEEANGKKKGKKCQTPAKVTKEPAKNPKTPEKQ